MCEDQHLYMHEYLRGSAILGARRTTVGAAQNAPQISWLFSRVLRRAMTTEGLSTSDLVIRCECRINQGSISNYRTGTAFPDITDLEILADALECAIVISSGEVEFQFFTDEDEGD